MSTPPRSPSRLQATRRRSYPPFIPPSRNKQVVPYEQDSHPVIYSDSCISRNPVTANFSGPFGRYSHIVDPVEGRYCRSPEPISRERGGDLDFSAAKAGLKRLMRMVKREEMRKGKAVEGGEVEQSDPREQ